MTIHTLQFPRLRGAFLLCALSATIAGAQAQNVKLTGATMARGFINQGPNKPSKPVGATSTFRPSDHKVFVLFNLAKPANGVARTVWYAVKVPGYAPNSKLLEIKTNPNPRLQFGEVTFTNTTDWPRGQFKVALYFNNTFLKNLPFSVK